MDEPIPLRLFIYSFCVGWLLCDCWIVDTTVNSKIAYLLCYLLFRC